MHIGKELYDKLVARGLIPDVAPPTPKMKYHNQPCWVDGHWFASKKEANRYGDLKVLLLAKKIKDLQLQPRFTLRVNEVVVCVYVGDFSYTVRKTGQQVLEDVKGVRTQVYNIKKRLLEAVHGIQITEV